MAVMDVAIIENNVIVNIGVFDVDTFDYMVGIWAIYAPNQTLTPMSQLPPGVWTGWYFENGEWHNPNPPPEDPPAEQP